LLFLGNSKVSIYEQKLNQKQFLSLKKVNSSISDALLVKRMIGAHATIIIRSVPAEAQKIEAPIMSDKT